MSGSVTKDLAQIAQAATQVAAGDTTVRTNVVRPDEIGATARAVDKMVETARRGSDPASARRPGRSDFLAAVGHDLRTPLSSMQAGLEALQDGFVDDGPEMIQRLLGNLATLGRLVDDLGVLGPGRSRRARARVGRSRRAGR